MIKHNMLEGIRHYLENMPDIDPKVVIDGLSLLRVHHELDLLSELVHSRLGFNARQMETLEALFHNPEKTLTPAQLTDVVHLTRSAMTSNLDSLERKGYIARAIHKEDRRMIAVTLTEKGIKFCEERLPIRYRDMIKIISLITPEEREALYSIYNKILGFLRQALKEDTIDFIKTSPAGA